MATAIAVYDSDGLVGRCDAKCHDAKIPGCTCICGGMNHGAGQAQAFENTAEMFDSWLDKYKENHEFDEVEVPAIYATKTRTATLIARQINSNAGYNRVLDVKRAKLPSGKWGWEVKIKPHANWKPDHTVFPPIALYVRSLAEVRKTYGTKAPRPAEQLVLA